MPSQESGERDFEGGDPILRGGARPPVAALIAFIDAQPARFGVEPICRVITEHGCKIAPNSYWVARKRPPSRRACRDAELVVKIGRIYARSSSGPWAVELRQHRW